MNYDITMCRCACSKAYTCHRWLQFQRLLKDTDQNKQMYISMYSAENGLIDENCPMYWEEKEGEK